MAIPRAVPAVLGTLAFLSTIALLVVYILLAQSLSDAAATSVRVTAILSATLEACCLILLSWLVSSYLPTPQRQWSVKARNIWLVVAMLIVVVAMVLSVATLVCFSTLPTTVSHRILGSNPTGFLIGSSIVLGVAFAVQAMFLVAHFIVTRAHDSGRSETPGMLQESQQMAQNRPLKSIPYSQTSPGSNATRCSTSMEGKAPPSFSSGRSATETMSSIRSSLSQVVRPISSKTRLVSGSQRSQRSSSQRSSKRPPSLDSTNWKEPAFAPLDGFDTWDTSAVDPQNRQTVLETSSPLPGRFLETIPASPTTSRSPSPGTPLDLEPPRMRRRSRSYSPASTRTARAGRTPMALHTVASESHIHPLFRSDSPIPPPAATPGTVVTAAPNAGQIISDRQSIRSLTRMRSGSLPTAPSPLSRQSSVDDFALKRDTSSPDLSISEAPESVLEEDEEDGAESERTMTPPIPDWILSAGSRKSLTGYNTRKHRDQESEESASS